MSDDAEPHDAKTPIPKSPPDSTRASDSSRMSADLHDDMALKMPVDGSDSDSDSLGDLFGSSADEAEAKIFWSNLDDDLEIQDPRKDAKLFLAAALRAQEEAGGCLFN